MTHHTDDTLERGLGTGNIVTAMFDDHATASRAVDRLIEAGFSQERVNLSRDDQGQGSSSFGSGSGYGGTSYGDGTSSSYGDGTSSSGSAGEHKGFWATVSDYFSSDDRSIYEEGMRRGHYLVSAEVADGQEDRAATILQECGAIDIDERAQSWRDSGWQGYGSGSGFAGAGLTGSSSDGSASLDRDARYDMGADHTRGRSADGQTVVPIAEERLNVGKRSVEGGRVRVHTRVAEKPVEEQVSLREEHVDVQRRPASGTTASLGSDPFKERTIEVETTREVPVVAKEAHVTEEVVVDKSATERTETVRDTVRHTEVDVDDSDSTARTGASSRTGDATLTGDQTGIGDQTRRRDKGKSIG